MTSCWVAVRRHSRVIWNGWKVRTWSESCVWIWRPATERWCASISHRHASWLTLSRHPYRESPLPVLLAGDRSHRIEEPRSALAHAPSLPKRVAPAAGAAIGVSPRNTCAGTDLSLQTAALLRVARERP